MSWVSKRGRPVVIPDDRTALRGQHVNARARIAWLLRVSRLARFGGSTRGFIDALAVYDREVGPTSLSRFETGQDPVPPSLVRGYEKVLDMPGGSLVGMCYRLDRVFGPALAGEPKPSMSRAEWSHAAARLEKYLVAREMTGIRWIRAAEAMTHPTGILWPPSALESVLRELVTEAMRAVGAAYISRMHAISVLLTDPVIGSVVVDTVEQLTREPGAQRVDEVIAILGDSSDPKVIAWLVRQFDQSEGRHQWGAAGGLMTAIVRRTLPAELAPDITRAVMKAAADGPERGTPAFLLAQRLSTRLTRDVVRVLGQVPVPTSEGARLEAPAGLARYRNAALAESGLDDLMLDRLLRESLSPDFVERRHFSLLMLMLSAYREVLADVALDALTSTSEPCIAESAVPCLRYLAYPAQRSGLIDLLGDPRHRMTALDALAHAGGVPADVDLVGMLGDVDPAELVLVAGLSGHPQLAALADNDIVDRVGASQSARWWMRVGPMISEGPRPGSSGGAARAGMSRDAI